VLQCSGLLLGFSLYSYHVRELLICWFFFIVLFALVAAAILGGALLFFYAEKYFSQGAGTDAPTAPSLALSAAEISLKSIPDSGQLK
jgi:hypothetical protein